MLSLKDVDLEKKKEAHKQVSVDLKEEIKQKNKQPGRICIVGELPRSKQGLGRAPVVVAALLMILALNMGQFMFLGTQRGNQALNLATAAVVELEQAGGAFLSGEEGAETVLSQEAQTLFQQAEDEASFLLAHQSEWLPEPSKVRSLRNLLEVGEETAEVVQHIARFKAGMQNLPEQGSLTSYLSQLSAEELEPATQKIQNINALLAEVNAGDLPQDYQERFIEYRSTLEEISAWSALWTDVKEPLLYALGDRYVQHYLVLLMNNDEMRRGGGFIGSYAILELNDGRISDLKFKDVYDLDGQLLNPPEMPVHELKELSNQWGLRDSNIDPDFVVSAQHALYLTDLEGEQGFDGVIGVNLSAAEELLKQLGPVYVESLGREVQPEHFATVMSTLIEAKTYGANSPKEVLGEFLNSALDQTGSAQKQLNLLTGMLSQIESKNVLFYHKNPQVQQWLETLNWAGTLPKLSTVEGDFLMPTFTNVGGDKTDRYMQTQMDHDTRILEDGSVVNELSITRTHTFTQETETQLEQLMRDYGFTQWNETLKRIMGRKTNRTGLRLYVPEGALIMDVSGDFHRDELQFFYDQEEDLSYYYVKWGVGPGQTQTLNIQYALPWKMEGDFPEYNFQLFKQPGLRNVQVSKTVAAPNDIMLSSHPLPNVSSEEGVDYSLETALEDLQLNVLYR